MLLFLRNLKDALVHLPSDDKLQSGNVDRIAFLLGELAGSAVSYCLHRQHRAELELVLKELFSSIPDTAGSFPACFNAFAVLCINANDDSVISALLLLRLRTYACLS